MDGKFSINELIEKCTFCMLIFNVPPLKQWNEVYNFLDKHYKKPVYVRNVMLTDKKYNVALVQYGNETYVDQAVSCIDGENFSGHILKTMKLHKNISLVTEDEIKSLSETIQVSTDFENINDSRMSNNNYKRRISHKPVECPSPEHQGSYNHYNNVNYRAKSYRMQYDNHDMSKMYSLMDSAQRMLNVESAYPYQYNNVNNYNNVGGYSQPVLHHQLADINKCAVIENLPKEATCGDVMLFLAHDSVPICGCVFDSRLSVRERKTAYVLFDQHYKVLDCILHFNNQIFMNENVLVGLHPASFLYDLLLKNYKVASSLQITREIITKISQVPADLFAPIPLTVSVYTGALEQIFVNPNLPPVTRQYLNAAASIPHANVLRPNIAPNQKPIKSEFVDYSEFDAPQVDNQGAATPAYVAIDANAENSTTSVKMNLSNCSCLMVTNLPEKATEHTLREHFSDFYDPVHVGVEQNGEGVPVKAYLYYENYDTVQQIISIMDGSLFHGKQINTVLI